MFTQKMATKMAFMLCDADTLIDYHRCYFSPVALQSIIMCLSVCLSVCLFVRLSVCLHNSKTAWPNFARSFLCMLPVAVAQSSYDDVAIHYALPVLWMTSCFHPM